MKEKILEILKNNTVKFDDGFGGESNAIDEMCFDDVTIDLNTLIEQHYYPKEFVLWCIQHVWVEPTEEKYLIDNEIWAYTFTDLYQYWLTQIKK
jgi:hypothetical protein